MKKVKKRPAWETKFGIFEHNDQIDLSKTKKCYAHCYPHKLPFTKSITDEPCHIHTSKLNMMHHIPTCWLFCKNYKFMMKNYKEFLKKKKKEKTLKER